MALVDTQNRGALYRVDPESFTEGHPLTSWWLVQGRTGGSTQLPRDGEAADQARRSGWCPSGVASAKRPRPLGMWAAEKKYTSSLQVVSKK